MVHDAARITVEPHSIPPSLWRAPPRQRLQELAPGVTHRTFALGRSALFWLCRFLAWGPGDRGLVPAYACDSIVRPFVAAGVTPEFYGVRSDMTADLDDIEARWNDRVRGGIIVHYFGWPQPARVREWLAGRDPGRGVWVEDLAHSLLTTVPGVALGRGGDIALSSFRKLIPCPDGAMLSFQRPFAEHGPAPKTGRRYGGHGLLRAGVMGAAGMADGGATPPGALSTALWKSTELLHRVLKGWRAANPVGAGAMSPVSRHLIERFDRAAAATRRRENARRLASQLRRIPGVEVLFPDPENGIVPMGLPAIVPHRASVQSALAARGIEAQHLWSRPTELEAGRFPQIEPLQANLLVFPVAERYRWTDMDAIAAAVAESVAS